MPKETIDEAPNSCHDYSPMTYLGLYRCQQNEDVSAFRALFTNRQLDTEMAYWEVMNDVFERYYPQAMCDPCMSGPKLSFAEALDTRYAKPFTLKNEIQITCGQVRHRLRAGDRCNETSTWLEQFRDYVAKQSLLQSRGFDMYEEEIAAELFITQMVRFPKSEYFPEGLTIKYERDDELECCDTRKFGKGECEAMRVIEDFLQKLECFENSNRVTDLFFHYCDWQDFKDSDDVRECMKAFRPELFIGNQLINLFNQEPLIAPRGINRVYTDPNGIRYWTVNVTKKFCDEHGNVTKYDMMPKGEILAFDLSGGECSFAPIMAYTPIMDIVAATEEPEQINAARYAMTDVDRKKKCWNREMTSNLMPILPYPNGSARLKIGCAKKVEAKTPVKATELTAAQKKQRDEEKKAAALKAKAEKRIADTVKAASDAEKSAASAIEADNLKAAQAAATKARKAADKLSGSGAEAAIEDAETSAKNAEKAVEVFKAKKDGGE